MTAEGRTCLPRSRALTAAGLAVVTIALVLFAGLVAGCAQEDLPQSVWDQKHPAGGSVGRDGGIVVVHDASTADRSMGEVEVQGRCLQALAQRLPARMAVVKAPTVTTGMSGPPPPQTVTVFDWQIADKIDAHCAGSCHTETNVVGGFVVTMTSELRLPAGGKQKPAGGFKNRGEEALWHIQADGDDPSRNPMPPLDQPEGLAWSQRSALADPDDIVVLANWLTAWLAAGSPSSFTMPVAPAMDTAPPPMDDAGADADAGPANSYLMAPAVANGLTNLGNCIPERQLVASEQTKSLELDQMFAGLQKAPKGTATSQERIGLPKLLSETDLVTFDSDKLARMGVISFAPAYPLWSDNAGKIRHIRVPRGQSVQFDKATQRFTIPPNTRFYKTFLKRIVDVDGNESWRKIETRLIVSRPDPPGTLAAPELDTTKISALFGTYQWNDDETEATLIDESLTDQEGFKDTLIPYDLDPTLAKSIRSSFPDDDNGRARVALALARAKVVRHYAIPGSQRCIHCHMGSASQSFVLGFMPVQLRHRPVGEGGIIEPSGVDEMSQFERLVDYGIITGVNSLADVLPLEQLEGDRKPRNDNELVAQGYMLGNCSHCHNPRGFPSVSFDHVLETTLNFLPSAVGGIFQFPLDQKSPRIKRGIRSEIDIPYITPSVVDSPDSPNAGVAGKANLGVPNVFAPKWRADLLPQFVYAPWRSLIYRNVDTPFSYVDDYTVFPHMPMDVPGYDCRAKRILGEWMVSIPAVRKVAEPVEYALPYDDSGNLQADPSAQPYVEVAPGDPQYATAVAAAQERLAIFQSGTRLGESFSSPGDGPRYATCPEADDIIDLSVDGQCKVAPVEDISSLPDIALATGVPPQAHWVKLDLTALVKSWLPRRSDWQDVLVNESFPATLRSICPSASGVTEASQKQVVDLLQNVRLDNAILQAVNEVPMGVWKDNAACNWSVEPWKSKGPTLDQVRASDPRPWMQTPPATATGQSHVYMQSYGSAVFNQICINCHGPKFDSVGRLAENLATMTGGQARVADLRDGLFGPADHPGANRQQVFPSPANAGDPTVDDWGARYMAWMALGGTNVRIPEGIVALVGHTPFLGALRRTGTYGGTGGSGANMLTIANNLCRDALDSLPTDPTKWGREPTTFYTTQNQQSLLWENGDAEMWLRLCSINNPMPVQPFVYERPFGGKPETIVTPPNAIIRTNFTALPPQQVEQLPLVLLREAYASAVCPDSPNGQCPVGDESGNVKPSLTDDNLHPWCVMGSRYLASAPGQAPSDVDAVDVAAFDAWIKSVCIGGSDCVPHGTMRATCSGVYPDPNCKYLPRCPPSFSEADLTSQTPAGWDDYVGTKVKSWGARGAINAGLAVFSYLRGIMDGSIQANTPFDHCEQLAAPDGGAPAGN